MSTKLSGLQNAHVGVTVGVFEVLCCQPLNYCKNMRQQGLPLTIDPRKLYRGLGAAALNMGSCTMIQFAVGGWLKKLVLGDGREEGRLRTHEEMGIGFAAGVVSAFAGSPLTLIMIQQQVRGGRSVDTMRRPLRVLPIPSVRYRQDLHARRHRTKDLWDFHGNGQED